MDAASRSSPSTSSCCAGEVERGADVRELGLDAVEPGCAALPESRIVVLGERDAPRELASPHLVPGVVAVQLRRGVRTDRLQHRKARLGSPGHRRADKAGVEQRLERRGDVRPRRCDRLERLEGRATGEHGEHRQHVSRIGIEQPHAPVDGRAERALPLGQVGGRPRQERERLTEPLGRSLDSQDPHARGGELDRERQSVERPGDPGDALGVRLRDLEVRDDLAGALDVEAHRRGGRDRRSLRGGRIGDVERWNAVLVLDGETERDAARGQDLQRRRRVERAPRRRRTRQGGARGCRRRRVRETALRALVRASRRAARAAPRRSRASTRCSGALPRRR